MITTHLTKLFISLICYQIIFYISYIIMNDLTNELLYYILDYQLLHKTTYFFFNHLLWVDNTCTKCPSYPTFAQNIS